MIVRRKTLRRNGSVLPLVVISLTALMGFVALALDLGLMAIARNQCQNAADAAAMAGARTLNGDAASSNNKTAAATNAQSAAVANSVLAQAILASQVGVTVGKYYYKQSATQFIAWPVDAGSVDSPSDPWTLVSATVTVNNSSTAFSRVMGVNSFNTTATATAVHRPRDVQIIADLSGSMRFDSLLGGPHGGARTQSMNPESVYPQFGAYSAVASAALAYSSNLQVATGEIIGPCNDTTTTAAGPALVNDFYQDSAALGTTQPAFTPAGNGDAVGWVGGDKPLKFNKNQGATYAKTVLELLNTVVITKDPAFEANTPTGGYDDPRFTTGTTFKGYTQGPSYWGKTFFVWPPDPRPAKDWRKLYFFKNDGVTPLDDNTLLWDSNGNWKVPRDGSNNNYRINYNTILNWIKNTNPLPLPPRLRAGGILYYDAIPNTIDNSVFPPTDKNQRFWKEYIDEVLGLLQNSGSGASPVYQVVTRYTGYGDDYAWGTPKISAKPTGGSAAYMDYTDNPERPKVHFWFGPMSMVDFLGNYNLGRVWWPGTCHEAATWECKIGIQAALQDIQKNHPNDDVGLTFFSAPKDSYGAYGYHNQVAVPLGRNYVGMQNALWFSSRTIANPTPEIRPYDNNGDDIDDVPRATGGTCYSMGLMLAYNQFAGSSTLQSYALSPAPTGTAGGNGRKGAQKLIIFETDGMVNTTATAGFTNSGGYNSYYNVRMQNPSNSGAANEYPTGVGGGVATATTQALNVVNQICALDSAGSPGYSTPGKPVLIHCIAFGTLFDPSNASAYKTNALNLLQQMQYTGGQAGGEQPTTATPLASYKIIVGANAQRIQNLQNAFSKIMQDGVQVSLIQ